MINNNQQDKMKNKTEVRKINKSLFTNFIKNTLNRQDSKIKNML